MIVRRWVISTDGKRPADSDERDVGRLISRSSVRTRVDCCPRQLNWVKDDMICLRRASRAGVSVKLHLTIIDRDRALTRTHDALLK